MGLREFQVFLSTLNVDSCYYYCGIEVSGFLKISGSLVVGGYILSASHYLESLWMMM